MIDLARGISESDYEGWVVYVDGQPIYEHVPWNPKLTQVIASGNEQASRAKTRNCVDWLDLPHDKIERVDLYFARGNVKHDKQPILRIDREPGADLRFIQMKMGGIVVQAGSGGVDRLSGGQARTGLYGYKIGYWNKDRNECELVEVTREEVIRHGPVGHPCWPRPHGFGLAPYVVGITESDIPEVTGMAPVGGRLSGL